MEFGGSPGVRDQGAVESALARPQNLFAYGEPDLCDLAAAYTAGICHNHGFIDGKQAYRFPHWFHVPLRERLYDRRGTGRSNRRNAVTGGSHAPRGRLRRVVAGTYRTERLI